MSLCIIHRDRWNKNYVNQFNFILLYFNTLFDNRPFNINHLIYKLILILYVLTNFMC